jgi:hypothetical protein
MEAERDLVGEFLAMVKDLRQAADAREIAREDVITLVTGAAVILAVRSADQTAECLRAVLTPGCCERHAGRTLYRVMRATVEASGIPVPPAPEVCHA